MHFEHNLTGNFIYNLRVSRYQKTTTQLLSQFTIKAFNVFSSTSNSSLNLYQDTVLNHPLNSSINFQNGVLNLCLGDTFKMFFPKGNFPLQWGGSGDYLISNNLQLQLPGAQISNETINGNDYQVLRWVPLKSLEKSLIHIQLENNYCNYINHYGMAFFISVKPDVKIKPISGNYCPADTIDIQLYESVPGL